MLVGDILPLTLQLDDGDTTKFVRVSVRRADRSEVPGSPFSLVHVANGLYQTSSVTMPNTVFATAQYIVYEDSAYTTACTLYEIAEDVFSLSSASLITDAQMSAIAATVWAYNPRNVTDLPKTVFDTEISLVKQELLEAIAGSPGGGGGAAPVYAAQLSIALDETADRAELLSWLTKNGSLVVDADSAAVVVLDGQDKVVANLGTDMVETANGVFRFTLDNISSIMTSNKAYTAKITITRGASTYTNLVAFVLATSVSASTTPLSMPAPASSQDHTDRELGLPQVFGIRSVYDGTLDKFMGS